jgi:uncharacterized protein (TIGR00290 family)
MFDEKGIHSRSHGLMLLSLEAQAESMGLSLHTANASWETYEAQFKKQAARFSDEGILHGVFGDIDLEPHREWVERVCRESGITPHLPLWKGNRLELMREFINAGFKALVVVVNTSKMPCRFLGRLIDDELISELEALGMDACGENGEFHSFVYDGPLFKQKLNFTRRDIISHDEYSFLPIAISGLAGNTGGDLRR